MRLMWLVVFAGCSASVITGQDMATMQTQDMAGAATVDLYGPGVDLVTSMQPDLAMHADMYDVVLDLLPPAPGDMTQPSSSPDLTPTVPDMAPAVCAKAADCGGAPSFYCLDASQPNWLNACGTMTPKYEADVSMTCKRLVIQVSANTLTSIQRWCGSLSPSPGNFVTFQLAAAQYEYQVLGL